VPKSCLVVGRTLGVRNRQTAIVTSNGGFWPDTVDASRIPCSTMNLLDLGRLNVPRTLLPSPPFVGRVIQTSGMMRIKMKVDA
jgi:hypothetical protein